MKQMFVVLLATLLLSALGMGQIPQLMSHQGYVADTSGTGITGTLPMTFRMFNDSTGGSAILTQSFPGVALTKGVFSVNIDVSTLQFTTQYWLETEVNSQTLAPRTRLTSAPYSLHSLAADTAEYARAAAGGGFSQWITNGFGIYYNDGNVGIGTATSIGTHKLEVNGAVAADYGKLGSSQYSENIELGAFTTGDRHPYIDFHASDAQPDWSSRIIREQGVNGSTEIATLGTGTLRMRTWTPGSSIAFNIANTGDKMTIASNGNVGIGTTNPQSTLAVNGTITAKQVDVTLGGWSDFVFAADYKLPDLESVEQHIKQFKHLPDVPSEKEVLSKGVDLGKMQSILLQKIEELTLYAIAQQKVIGEQAEVLKAVQQRMIELESGGDK